MSTTRTFRNTNPSFGDSVAIEYETKEEAAADMMPSFEEWANDAENAASQDGQEFDRDAWIEKTREEFIDSLVEEITGPAVEVFNLTVYQRGADHSEIGDGAERVIVLTSSLDEEITIEADDEDSLRNAYDSWSGDAVRDPDDFDLLDSDTANVVRADDLGIDDEEYARLVRESILSSSYEGHVSTSNGRRVYAA